MGEQIGNTPADASRSTTPLGVTKRYLPMKPHEFFDCMMRPDIDSSPRHSFSKTNPQDSEVPTK